MSPRRGEYRLELIKRSSRGTVATIAYTNKLPSLEDGKKHSLLWSRDTSGRMRISIDGNLLIEVTDRSFSDPFMGFAFVNKGGDYAIRVLVIQVP